MFCSISSPHCSWKSLFLFITCNILVNLFQNDLPNTIKWITPAFPHLNIAKICLWLNWFVLAYLFHKISNSHEWSKACYVELRRSLGDVIMSYQTMTGWLKPFDDCMYGMTGSIRVYSGVQPLWFWCIKKAHPNQCFNNKVACSLCN